MPVLRTWDAVSTPPSTGLKEHKQSFRPIRQRIQLTGALAPDAGFPRDFAHDAD